MVITAVLVLTFIRGVPINVLSIDLWLKIDFIFLVYIFLGMELKKIFISSRVDLSTIGDR